MAKSPLQIELKFSDLPADSKQRHEMLVGIFGQYIIWLRNWAIETSREAIESQEAREKLGTIQRRKYDAIAALNPDERLAACKFAEATVDRVIQLLLTMFSGTGTDQRLGDDHAIRFKLLMEILEVENAEIVSEETINRGGEKFFANYWGRWLNHPED